jgi:hypothetical protein
LMEVIVHFYLYNVLATLHMYFWFKILRYKILFEISNKDKATWSTNVQHFWKAFNVATLALGLQPMQGVARLRAKREAGSHFTCSQECKECEGMNPHIHKWTLMLQIFRVRLQGSKILALKSFLYH